MTISRTSIRSRPRAYSLLAMGGPSPFPRGIIGRFHQLRRRSASIRSGGKFQRVCRSWYFGCSVLLLYMLSLNHVVRYLSPIRSPTDFPARRSSNTSNLVLTADKDLAYRGIHNYNLIVEKQGQYVQSCMIQSTCDRAL